MNAKTEFIEIVKDVNNVKCAYVTLGGCDVGTNCANWGDKPKKKSVLPVKWDENDLAEFLQSIDYEYDCGFGCQELFGYIWMNDGTWIERSEYDGSESWEHKVVPVIPFDCLCVNNVQTEIKIKSPNEKHSKYQRLSISSSILDRLGFSEYWDEHCVWGTRTLNFQNNTSIIIIEHLEQDDIYEGYGETKEYGPNYYRYSSEMDGREGEEINRNLYFIEDLYDVIEYICPDNIPEFVERCKKANMASYIREYLDNR